MNLEEKTKHTTSIYEGKIIDLDVVDVELPDGRAGKREVVRHPGAVAIIAVTEEEKLVLVKQYRKPLGKEIYEIPAGKKEAGEEPKLTASRELAEETGYVANEMELLFSTYTSPGFADELIELYEAKGLSQGERSLDEDEFVEVIEVSLAEAEGLIKEGLIHDAKTVLAVQHLRLQTFR
ncbi:NUDIX domain-containing protein [Salsuginibacillus kocurii]|uniref:NUDIX domain-containing protein n=1 Tax=Salsuginibacillus kocurii TaxID=427078 RepID=UPI000382ECE1|nr:NUDIX hydrolase [Salsuginibacillus kocurii]